MAARYPRLRAGIAVAATLSVLVGGAYFNASQEDQAPSPREVTLPIQLAPGGAPLPVSAQPTVTGPKPQVAVRPAARRSRAS